MEKKRLKNTILKSIIVLLTLTAIGWDITTSLRNIQSTGTFRPESEFDAVSSATTKVAIVPSDYSKLSSPVSRSTEPTYEQIEDMVRKAVELQGGLSWLIKEGDKVMLKVNLVSEVNGSGTGEVTDVRVTKAVIKIIDEIAHGKIKITVAEGTPRKDDDPASTGSKNVWKVAGYQSLLTDPYLSGIDLQLLNLNGPLTDLVEITIPDRKKTASPHEGKYHIHKAITETDVFVSIPVLKIHDTGITNALKNQIGIAPSAYYGYNKEKGIDKDGNPTASRLIHTARWPEVWTEEEITDLSNIAGIDLVIVDAIMCLERQKTYATTNQVRMNTIIAGTDPVAVDHVCAKLFYINPDDVNHITLSEKIGLGTNDIEKIEITGASIENVRKKVVKNQTAVGLFGQSNRTWILSEPFNGTDISTESIAGEANITPKAGENGWSQPIYFFDDRIDLLNYYNARTNIITYAFTYFYAPAAKTAELWIGSHEGIYVYLNGEKVYSFSGTNTYGSGIVQTERKNINIKKGYNKLLVKTLNKTGDYTFALNICDVETNTNYAGNRISGLKFMTDTASTVHIGNNQYKPEIKLSTHPNPATFHAIVYFELPNSAKTTLDIYNLNGQHISNLVNSFLCAGQHKAEWNIADQRIAKGIYICMLKAGNYSKSSKIIVR